MKNVIEKFYYGEVIPCDAPPPKTEKYKEVVANLAQTEENIIELFPSIKNYLDDYKDILHQIAQLESAADFSRGFRLGASFMYDILKKGKE